MLRFIKSLQFIYKPFCWLKFSPYSEPLDKEINKLLDEGILFTKSLLDAGAGLLFCFFAIVLCLLWVKSGIPGRSRFLPDQFFPQSGVNENFHTG